jgi:hypothetical protein
MTDRYVIIPQWLINEGLKDKSIIEKNGKLYLRGYIVMSTDELAIPPSIPTLKKQSYRDLEYNHKKQR